MDGVDAMDDSRSPIAEAGREGIGNLRFQDLKGGGGKL
jgi:hypothetical protein